MRKILFVIALVAISMAVNAQLYIGGGLGLGVSSTKPDQGNDKLTNTAFSIIPEIGYSLNDKFDVGISLGFTLGKEKQKISGVSIEETLTSWEIAPYLRYSFVEFGKFKVLGKASLYVMGGKHEVLSTETKFTEFGITIAPMLTYDISDKFVLFTDLNFLELGFSYNKIKNGNSETSFGLGFDADDLVNVGAITIGFAYKF